MSDRTRGRTSRRMRMPSAALAAVALALSGVVAEAGAQTAEEYRRRLDIFEPQWHAARAAVAAREQQRRAAARSISMERGPLRLVVDSALVPMVSEPADVAARIL